MKLKYFFLMILIVGMCCIINPTPFLASSTTATEDPSVIEITSPLELAEALGGDASWVNGNEVTLASDIPYTSSCIKISGSEISLNLNGYSFNRAMEISGGDVSIKNGKLCHEKINLTLGNLVVTDCQIECSLIANDGNMTITNCVSESYYNVAIYGGNVEITNYKATDLYIYGGNVTITDSYIYESFSIRGGDTTIISSRMGVSYYDELAEGIHIRAGNVRFIDCRVYDYFSISGGSITITDSHFEYSGGVPPWEDEEELGDYVQSCLMISGGTTTITNSEFEDGSSIRSGNVTIVDSFFERLSVNGGTILLKNSDAIMCIEDLRYKSGDISLDENSVAIVALGDYDSDNPLPLGYLDSVYIATKDAVSYYELTKKEPEGFYNSVVFPLQPNEGYMVVMAETKDMATAESASCYSGVTSYSQEKEISISEEHRYVALRLCKIEDKKIAVTKIYEWFLDESMYPPRYVWVNEKDYHTVEITWYPSRDAKGYQVYRATEENGKYTRIADIKDPSVTEFLDTNVIPNFKYYYKVRNVIETGENVDYSPLSKPYLGMTELGRPIVKASSVDYKTIKLSWNEVAGATGYAVYRKNSKGNDEWIGCVWGDEDLTYIDTGRKVDKEYSYRVRAFLDVDNLRIQGKKSIYCTGMAVVGAPEVSTAAEAYDKIKISWNSVPGADGYYVYRAEKTKGEYMLIKDISDKDTLFYIDKGMICGKNYYYKVQSYRIIEDESGDELTSDKHIECQISDFVSGKALPSAPSITVKKNSSTSAKITWKKVFGADGYQIYIYDREKKKYVLLDTVTSDVKGYIAKKLKKGVKHYFKVRAYKMMDGSKKNGAFSEIKKVAL